MLKWQPSENQIIYFVLVLVLILGVPTYRTLAQETSEPGVQEKSVAGLGADFESDLDSELESRVPASIPKSELLAVLPATSKISSKKISANKLSANFNLELNLRCSDKSLEPASIDKSFLRLTGKNCSKNQDLSKIEIVNESNGFTATLFVKNGGRYQSDLIHLVKGTNKIKIRFSETTGKLVEEQLIVRRN